MITQEKDYEFVPSFYFNSIPTNIKKKTKVLLSLLKNVMPIPTTETSARR